MQKNNKRKTKAERSKVNRSYSERVKVKWFCCASKLGFLQLICKASLIFRLNLELALWIVLKQRELYESEHVSEECRCLKVWDLLYFLICSPIIGKACRHFKTRIEEHIKKDNKFHIFKHLLSTPLHRESLKELFILIGENLTF